MCDLLWLSVVSICLLFNVVKAKCGESVRAGVRTSIKNNSFEFLDAAQRDAAHPVCGGLYSVQQFT